MADINFVLETSRGNQLLDTDGGGPIGLNDSTTGFGVPPVYHRFLEGAGAGGKRRNTRVGMRDFDLGLIFLADDRLNQGANIRELARKMRGLNPDPKLVAYYATGEVYELGFVYQSGLEIDYSQVRGNTFQAVVSCIAEQPFWTSREEVTYTLSQGTARGLLPKLGYLRVSSASVIGTIAVNNPGDVEAFPIWKITGPATSVVISSGAYTFTYEDAIAGGTTITINTEDGTVVDQAGVDKYGGLSAAPKLFPLPPGNSVVNVTAAGSDANTRVVLSYRNRRELIF